MSEPKQDMSLSPLLSRLPNVRGQYRAHAQLSKVNWFQVGGPAEVLFRPEDPDDLAYFLAHKPDDISVTVLGVGSNLLVRDGGIDGIVIRLGRGFTMIERKQDQLVIGAGALNFNVASFCREAEIGGLEFLIGIPGTIGGALAMNAGAYGVETSSVLVMAEAIDEKGQVHHLAPSDFGFIYRGNTLPEGFIFTKAILQGKPSTKAQVAALQEEITKKREESQPIRNKTSGSTFTNPPGSKRAWQLIDEAGCRGLVIGDAQVSEKHCNFLINRGNATAADIEALGEEVRRRVKEKFGITLEWEIKRIGKP